MRVPYLYYIGIIILLMQCNAIVAQTQTDSTDVFFRHLQLKEVIVTGLTGQTKYRDSATPMTLVTAQDLRHSLSTNVIDALSLQPGVTQITTGSAISKPVIRGLGYNRVVLVADGVRLEGQQWGDEHGVELDAGEVHSAEILKGPASLMYGSDAMAGVIVMRQQPIPMDGERQLQWNNEYQTNNGMYATTANYTGRQSLFHWDVRLSGKSAHAYQNKYDGRVAGSQLAERAFSALVGILPRWGFLRLKVSHFNLTPSIVEGERNEESGLLQNESRKICTYGHTLPFQRVQHSKVVLDNMVRLKHGQLRTIVGYQLNHRREYEEQLNVYDLRMLLHTMTFDVRYLSDEASGWKSTVGTSGMLQRSLNKGEERLIPDHHLFEMGAFGMLSHEWGPLVVSGGLRFDRRMFHSSAFEEEGEWRFTDFSRRFNGMTGSLGAVWHVNEGLDVRLNMSRGFRAPNISELGSNGVHEGTQRYERGNEHLRPEYSLQLDFGVDYVNSWLTANAMLFANEIDHYIYSERTQETTADNMPVYVFRQKKARLMGFESSIDVHPVHCLHLYTAFSYVHSVAKGVEREARHLPLTPAPHWLSELKWEVTHSGQRLNNAWISVQADCYLRQNCIYEVNQTETPTPSYTLFNISAGTDLMWHKRKVAELQLAVSNLTDRAYQNHLSRLKYTDRNSQTMRQGVFNMGRNFIVKLNIPIRL